MNKVFEKISGRNMCRLVWKVVSNVGAMLDYINYTPRTLKEILNANDFGK